MKRGAQREVFSGVSTSCLMMSTITVPWPTMFFFVCFFNLTYLEGSAFSFHVILMKTS